MQDVLQPAEAFGLLLFQFPHRYLRPAGHHIGDLPFADHQFPRGLLLLPAVANLLDALPLLLLLPLDLAGLLIIFRGNGLLLLLLQRLDLLLQRLDLLRLHKHRQAQFRGRFVDQVNRLVRQEPVVDITGRQADRGAQRLIRDRHLMMFLIAPAEALEDLIRLVLRRLLHRHRLEPALQGRVLLDIFTVLVNRRRADQLDLAAGKRRLQDIRSVDGPFRAARADDRMDLVDEQEHLAVLHDLGEHSLDALLKLAAVFRPGHHAGQIQGHDAFLGNGFRHVALGDHLRQPLHHGGLAHARLADQTGIVLRAAA